MSPLRQLCQPRHPLRIQIYVALLGAGLTGFAPSLPAQSDGYTMENAQLRVRLLPRTPDQIAAFYEARGFPARMIDELRSKCFLTTGVSNRSERVIWHDLAQWRFSTPEGPVERITRADWRARWTELQAPMPSQSTFRWTLLPERLDFQPGESEGGNIILPRTTQPITVEAPFHATPDASDAPILLRIENVRCAP